MDYAPLAATTLGAVVRRPGLEPGEVKPLDLQSRPLPATEYRPIYYWWIRLESNQLPAVDHVSHSPVLPTQIDSNSCFKGRPPLSRGPLWWNRWDLNPQPFPCKGIALPIAPRPHVRPPFYRVAGQIPLCVTHFRLK